MTGPQRLFVDTSAWFAYANRDDPDHKRVRTSLDNPQVRLITSNFVFDETVTLCASRLGHAAAKTIGTGLQDGESLDLVHVSVEDERAAWELFLDRSDKDYSFTDCTSFVLMRRLRLSTAVAIDDDFTQEGFAVLPRSR